MMTEWIHGWAFRPSLTDTMKYVNVCHQSDSLMSSIQIILLQFGGSELKSNIIISLISLSVTGKFPVICNELFLSGGAIKSSTVTCLESK